ncbi:MAG: 4-(cytidine 5'-diphospho)-2-C-methyl-D-erythritol kinase [Bacteroidota bacterium]
MLSFPNAKINIGLYITGKQDNGYHNIETVFYPVPLYDILEVVPSEKRTTINLSGIKIPCAPEENLVFKAWKTLHKAYDIPPVKINLHKLIPPGGGLGGGSSDAAFCLSNLNKQFKLGLDDAQLMEFALRLGSDCPFFIKNRPVFAQGRGEITKNININLEGKHLLLVFPDIHINTGEFFKKTPIHAAGYDLRQLQVTDLSKWKHSIENKFEDYVFDTYPSLRNIKNELYKAGAEFAIMTGTGSVIYGIFTKKPNVKQHFSTLAYKLVTF